MTGREYSISADQEEKITVDKILDRKALLARLSNDLELLQELIAFYLEDYPRLLQDIETAIGNSDAATLHKAAHTLKGALGNFSAQKAFELSYKLELGGFEKDFSNTETDYSNLVKELRRVDRALRMLSKEYASGNLKA